MSLHINDVKCLSLDLRIQREALQELYDEGQCPEVSFIEDHLEDEPDDDGFVKLRKIDWGGEGSGWGLEEALAKTVGSADLVAIFESGHMQGLMVRDGKVTHCDVSLSLVPPKAKAKRGKKR